MNRNPVGWFEIYVQDMERARRFYESVFQVRLEKLPTSEIQMWSFPSLPEQPGAVGALVRVEGFPSGGNSVLVYFSCEDCAVIEGRVTTNGGRIQRPKMTIGEHGFVSLIIDTEGNMLGLHSLK